MALRNSLPIFEPKQNLQEMSIQELRDDKNFTSICGYIFKKDGAVFRSYWGRDVTYRLFLHHQGISIDQNDDGGVSPFPKLEEMREKTPKALEYVLQSRDRMQHKSG